MSMLSEKELKQLGQQLRIHREALQEHLRETRAAAGGEHYIDIAGSVHSQSDESFAELTTALSNASRGREADALRETEDALRRLQTHAYGNCVDCDEPIALERLRVDPTTQRCLSCQQRHEDPHGGKDPTPSL